MTVTEVVVLRVVVTLLTICLLLLLTMYKKRKATCSVLAARNEQLYTEFNSLYADHTRLSRAHQGLLSERIAAAITQSKRV